MNCNSIVVHIPHSSLKLSEVFLRKVKISEEELKKENLFLCDTLVNTFVPKNITKLLFNYSRIMCDVERYHDNSKESMYKIGMGYIYEKTSDKKELIDIDEDYTYYIDRMYFAHHNKLNDLVKSKINDYNKCTIIDLHSFSTELVNKLFNINDTPDICIGTNYIYDNKLLNFTKEFFEKKSYSVRINFPYSGSLIPEKYIKDNRVSSIMIEINKRIYVDEYKKFEKIMKEYFEKLIIL